MTLAEFFEHNYRVRKLRGKSPNTVRLYRFSITNFSRVLGHDATLDDLTDDNVALAMQSMLDRGCSPYTANKERSQLLALWRFAAQLQLVPKWPTIGAEHTPERVPVAWMQEDIQRLMQALERETGMIGDAPANLWWRSLVCVCLDTGERIGAIVQAEWSWIERDWILVPAEARKGHKRDRRYLLACDTLARLRELQRYTGRQGRVFPWPYCGTYLWGKYTKILKKHGLPCGPKDKFHRFRKTVGSVVHAAGLDAQEVLDHNSRRTTKAYLDPRFTREKQPSDVLAAWLRNPPKPTNADKKTG